MVIFNGKKEAEKILLDIKNRIIKEKLSPRLAVILVGDDSASKLYVKLKKEKGQRVGVEVDEYVFKGSVKEKNIIQKIKNLNKDDKINGIIVQLPLPSGLNADKIIGAIDPKKDVDGFHVKNRNLLKKGKPYFFPVLPSAILVSLLSSGKNIKKKNILAIVNSNVFGESLKDYFKVNRLKLEYILKKKSSFKLIKSKTEKADVIITVCGCPNLIKGDMIKNEAILIDAGIRRKKNGIVCGDVDIKNIDQKACFLTPIKGGIGPLTVSLLLKNAYMAAKKYGCS